MKPIDVKSGIYTEYVVEQNDKDSKFKVGDNVAISNYKNVFAKGCNPNCSEEVFMIKKNTVPWACY